MSLLKHLTQDWERNKGYSKGKLLTCSFRLANLATRNKLAKVILTPYLAFYKFWVEWIIGTEIPYQTRIGKGLIVYHGINLVVNRHTIIGDNCMLRHSITLGNKGIIAPALDCPIIGNNVNIGAHACILGNIHIGDNVIIGAGSIVTKDVPANTVVAGNPARIIRTITTD
jgi:putative colanic acid biosynthesis acetyltransferase WcaB